MSAAGGPHRAVERIRAVGGRALQLFTRNQRRWDAQPMSPAEARAFAEERARWGPYPVAAHASYLINLASPDPEVAERSAKALAAELERDLALDVPWLVLHPGAHLGAGVGQGLDRVAANLDRVLAQVDGTMVLLETTAGQGTTLGARFEELAGIVARCAFPRRLGVCLDTAHMLAAGYPIRDREGYGRTMAHLEETIGLERVMLFHLNDSKAGEGSRRDRHEHIGQGELGLEPFRLLLADGRFRSVPMVLETPKGGKDGLALDRKNLALLRRLAKGVENSLDKV
jgi:deoxyribonuclease-4